MGRVEGKVVLITGGASGLGRADALRLAEEGASLVLTDINLTEGEKLSDEIGDSAIFLEQDVSDEKSWEIVIAKAVKEFGRLDALVNNAGIAPISNIEQTSTEEWRRVMGVHLDATFFGCRAAIPEMARSGGGSIINMSSIAALVGLSSYLSYSAAKGAIRSITKSIAMHCLEVGNNIRCNSVHPGSISTPMVHNALEKLAGIKLMEQEDPEAVRKKMRIGEPLDIANMVLFLVSDESKHMTGAELVVDQGATIGQASR